MAITQAESHLGEIGNGYAWTVEAVLSHLEPVLKKHLPGFSLADYTFD
jgi:hypothetical protein